MRLAAQLRRKPCAGNDTYVEVKALQLDVTPVVAFPQTDLRESLDAFTQADIDRLGRDAFQKWGGEARLAACARLGKKKRGQVAG